MEVLSNSTMRIYEEQVQQSSCSDNINNGPNDVVACTGITGYVFTAAEAAKCQDGDGNNAGDASSAFSCTGFSGNTFTAASGNTCTDSNGTSVGDSTSQETCTGIWVIFLTAPHVPIIQTSIAGSCLQNQMPLRGWYIHSRRCTHKDGVVLASDGTGPLYHGLCVRAPPILRLVSTWKLVPRENDNDVGDATGDIL